MHEDKANIDEEHLWQTFLGGDNASLEKIYRTYLDELYQYGNKWLSDPTIKKVSFCLCSNKEFLFNKPGQSYL